MRPQVACLVQDGLVCDSASLQVVLIAEEELAVLVNSTHGDCPFGLCLIVHWQREAASDSRTDRAPLIHGRRRA